MLKIIGGFIAGLVFVAALAYNFMGSLMFREIPSPFGMEETVARIQQNIQKAGNGWSLIGLRDPAKAVQHDGGNVLPVLISKPAARATPALSSRTTTSAFSPS